MSKKVIGELNKDLGETNSENLNFRKNFINLTGHSWYQWGEYEKWINHNIVTLDSVKDLVGKNKYRDCYVLLRSVLEAYLVIKLAMLGNKYLFDLLPTGKGKTKESKADLLNRARSDPNLSTSNVLSKKLIEDETGYRVRIIFENLPVKDTKVFVPRHYFLAKEYDPDAQYLSDLIIRNRWRDLPESKARIKEHKQLNRNIQNNFFSVGALLDFFKINGFVTTRQKQAIFVHYNYLSKFTHSTVVSYETLPNNNYYPHADSLESFLKNDFDHELLILLYCNFLSLYFVELQLNYFCRQPDLKVKNNYRKYLKKKIGEIKKKYAFFWFIYNKPYEYDIFQYKMKGRFPKTYKIKPSIPYYTDPFTRLKNLKGGWSNKVLGHYEPPKILYD